MTGSSWVKIGDRLIYRRTPVSVESKRSDLAMPMIRSDRISPVQSMADGKVYDTASGLARSHEGFETVGRFNPDNVKAPPSRSITNAQAAEVADQATNMLSQGYKPDVVDRNF